MTTKADLRTLLGDRLASARNGARSGQYQILLGAGASIGATNSSGAVPDATGLVKLLASKYVDARISDDMRLDRAYQRAVRAAGADNVWWYLRSLFAGVLHEEWFTELASMPWRRTWTLNIDDAFERAYQASDRSEHARLKTVDWVDDYIEPVGPEVVHLHGRVGGDAPSPLVFSLSEYHAAAAAHGVWHKVFRGVLSSEPVVIVGAKVLEDLDVETLVLAANPRSYAPSIIVDPYISDDNAWELSGAGFLIFRDTAAAWIAQWAELFGLDRPNRELLYESATVNIPQLVALEPARYAPAPDSHDFFGGSEPLWSDACQSFIAELDWTKAIVEHINIWATKGEPGVFVQVVYLRRLAGATAGLLSIAYQAASRGVRVLQFDRSVRFNPQRVVDLCRNSGPTVVMVDGGYAFADDLSRLAALSESIGDVHLYILFGERPQRASLVEEHFAAATYPIEVRHVNLRRSESDAKSIVKILMSQGRGETLTLMKASDRIRHFKNRDIFSAMSEVENAAGFRARVDREISQLDTRWHRELVVLLALVGEGGIQISLTEAGFALDVSVNSVLSAIEDSDHLGALIEIDKELLLSRHRVQAVDSLISSSGGTLFLESLATMLQRLAVLVPREGFASRTRGSALVRHLMSAKMLHGIFPHADVDKLYQTILPQYRDWNARYWEQRSIYARITKNLDPAVSFAERAVSIHDDSFTRNTLAVNLLSKAESIASRDDPSWREYYSRGIIEFASATNRDRSTAVARWARLDSTLSLLAELADRAERGRLRESVQDVLDDWAAAYSVYRVSLPRVEGSDAIREAELLSTRFANVETRLSSHSVASAPADVSDEELLATAIRESAMQMREAVTLAKFGQIVRDKLGDKMPTNWGSHGSLKRAILSALPDAKITPENTGTLHPADLQPRPHAMADIEERVADAIRRQVGDLDRPTPMAAVASRVKREVGSTGESTWGSHATFKAALLHAIPGVEIDPSPPGFVLPIVN